MSVNEMSCASIELSILTMLMRVNHFLTKISEMRAETMREDS
jgi:hypothetical protein